MAAITFLAVLALPATALAQPRWHRGPSGSYCVKVYDGRSSRRMAGWTTLHYDPRTNTAWFGSIYANLRRIYARP